MVVAAVPTAADASTFVVVMARGAKDSQIFYFPMWSGKKVFFRFYKHFLKDNEDSAVVTTSRSIRSPKVNRDGYAKLFVADPLSMYVQGVFFSLDSVKGL